MESFLADKPVHQEKEDKFQRFTFSQRIADTIVRRDSPDSIVIGLYGAWGEGKTSMLNFIEQEIEKHPEIIQFTFNPWRFSDESTLLISFFNTLATNLKNALPKDNITEPKLKKWVRDKWEKKKEPLKTDWETLGDIINEYVSGAVSIVNGGEAAKTIGNVLSNVNPEKLKKRLEDLLKKHKKKIVIFIDDIDRLDKSEIHAIFRLVKLTGDFAYTTYLLSFDEKMVSAAIGEKFSTGDSNAGSIFLEKIIQIPIQLPHAPEAALKDYCFTLIDQSLKASNIELSPKQNESFVNGFSSNFLIKLTTPRLAIRYSNALKFSLPLLFGEANYVDLLLIEATRVFFPEAYEMVKKEPGFFIGKSDVSGRQKDEFVKKLDETFNRYCSKYSEDEKAYAKGALMTMFPLLNSLWGSWSFEDTSENNLRLEKRIASTFYFNRYFSYTVLKGDISDAMFDDFIDGMGEDEKTNIDNARAIVQLTTPGGFISKVRSKEKLYDEQTAIKLIHVFASLGTSFHDDRNLFYGFTSPWGQNIFLVAQLIRNQVNKENQYAIVEWIINSATPFTFAYEIFNQCKGGQSRPKIFHEEDYNKLARKLFERAKEESGDLPIWELLTYESKYLLNTLVNDGEKESLKEYVYQKLNENPAWTFGFLKIFCPYTTCSSNSAYYGAFDKRSYEWLKEWVDADKIFEFVQQHFKSIIDLEYEIVDLDKDQTDENLLNQFIFFYKKDSSTSPKG